MRLAAAGLALVLLGGCGLFGGGSPDEPGGSDEKPTNPLVGWSPVDPAELSEGGVLRVGIDVLPSSFNPAVAAEGALPGRSGLDRLLAPTTGSAVRLGEDGGWEVDPAYAESVEVTGDDPLEVRVELQPDAVWQDGSPITSVDMSAWVEAVAQDEGWDDVETVEADGDLAYTVRFERVRSDWPLFVYPRLPADISTDAERFADGFAEEPVPSNGPFAITDIDLETGTVTQEPNPRWWGPRPVLDQIVWRLATPEVQAEAFAADELDVAEVVPSSGTDLDADLLRTATGSRWTHLTLNAGGSGPLADDSVRRAVVQALDREALAEAGVADLDVPPLVAESVFTVPGQQGHVDASDALPAPDADAAREVLSDVTLRFPVPAGEVTEARAEAVADQLREAGATVEVRPVAPEDFVEQVLVPRDFDLLTFSYDAAILGVAPMESRLRPAGSVDNVTGVAAGSAEVWEAARVALDPDDRAEAVAALDAQVLEPLVLVPLTVPPEVLALRDGVANYGPSTFLRPDWTRVGLVD
ncbi:ABC transporter family substrate-binding protein [Aeromicrobium halocynthiae]|uniref:ABC transporter family substrate-binding protein n=1 Tax=Aeromicrobium halocynthiae TaxID=560557 RepID=A0ABN2VTW2_9ACTN